MDLTETGKVTSKSMVNIPSAIRRKYGIMAGDELAFVEEEGGVFLVRIPPLGELFGSGRKHGHAFLDMARELEKDRRREAKAESE